MHNLSKKLIVYSVWGTLQLTLIGAAYAQLSPEAASSFISTQEVFEKGLRGSKSDNEAASDQFEGLLKQYPDDPLLLAYFGSTFTLKANHALLPWQKLKLGDKGLDIIDKALKNLNINHDDELVRGVPVSIETKFVAATTFMAVPDIFFHRYQSGVKLLEDAMNSAAFAKSPKVIQARFYYQSAQIAKKNNDKNKEIESLKQTIDLDPQGKDAAVAQSRLTQLGI